MRLVYFLTKSFSEILRSSASALAVSVLPTQVGHKNKKLQVGLSGLFIPALLLVIADITASIASFCHIIFSPRVFDNFFNLSISHLDKSETGIFVD